MPPLWLGVDLGTSGLRLALIDQGGLLLTHRTAPYPRAFEDPQGWREGLSGLVSGLPEEWRRGVAAMAIDGTSGTLLMCDREGNLPGSPLDRALPYHLACPEQSEEALRLLGDERLAGTPSAPVSRVPVPRHDDQVPAASASGSLVRALRLLALAERAGISEPLLLRHQADWLMGWLLGDWRWGEEGNNLRLGWDAARGRWLGDIAGQAWSRALPEVRPSGSVLGTLSPQAALSLGLPSETVVVAGSTDSNAAVLAADPGIGDGVAVLGTTLVLKQFVPAPLIGPGVNSHRVGGRWLLGGASNAGAGVLRRFFSDDQLAELSRQIDPAQPTGLDYYPLPRPGERFPVDDPTLQPRLTPRPISDALYLQGLLEGLTAIEKAGWGRFRELGAAPLHRVLTLGGGARNPQWRQLRQRALGVPVLNRPNLSAAMGMARLARESRTAGHQQDPPGTRMGRSSPASP